MNTSVIKSCILSSPRLFAGLALLYCLAGGPAARMFAAETAGGPGRFVLYTQPLKDNTIDEVAKLAKAGGFSKIEIRGMKQQFSPHPTADHIAAVLAAEKKYGVEVVGIASYLGKSISATPESPAEMMAAAKRTVDAAAQIGARFCRATAEGKRDRGVMFALVPFLKELSAYAAPKGIQVCVETYTNFMTDPEGMMELARSVGEPNFGFIFLPDNIAGSGRDYKKALGVMRDRIFHVRVTAAVVDREINETAKGPGKTPVDLPWLVRELRQAGYKGEIAVSPGESAANAEGILAWTTYLRGI